MLNIREPESTSKDNYRMIQREMGRKSTDVFMSLKSSELPEVLPTKKSIAVFLLSN